MKDSLNARRHIQLSVDRREVSLYRVARYSQPGGNFFVRRSRRQKGQDTPLTLSQLIMASRAHWGWFSDLASDTPGYLAADPVFAFSDGVQGLDKDIRVPFSGDTAVRPCLDCSESKLLVPEETRPLPTSSLHLRLVKFRGRLIKHISYC